MQSRYMIDILSTTIGQYAGSGAGVGRDDLAALVIKKLLERNPSIDPNQIEDVVFGAANQAGEDNRDVARMAVLLAGLPTSVGGVTVNRLCASGLQAIMDASRGVLHGDGQLYIAGGVESMTRAPFVMAKGDEPFSRKAEVYDTTIGWRFTNSKLYHPFSMGETAENVADKWKVSREDQDKFALASQQKYFQANAEGKFKEELISVSVVKGKYFFSSRRRHTRYWRDWSSDVCSSDLYRNRRIVGAGADAARSQRRRQSVRPRGAQCGTHRTRSSG